MNELIFSVATAADQPQLMQLLSDRQNESNKLHGGTNNFVLAQGEFLFKTMLADPNIQILVGKIGADIVATVTLYFLPRIRIGGYLVILEDVLVKDVYRGRGFGSDLINYAINLCKQDKRVKKIKLGSRKDEAGLHQFYEKLGFVCKEKLFQLAIQ